MTTPADFPINGAIAMDHVQLVMSAGGDAVTWNQGIPGHPRFFTADPFGNRLEFLSS